MVAVSEISIDFFAGCVGGAAGVLVGHPLDTVKVRLQTQNPKFPVYNGTWNCFHNVLRTEGIQGLYRGISSPLASLAFINAVIFGVHGTIMKQSENRQSLTTNFMAGAFAGSAQALIASPMELLKLRSQLQDRSSTQLAITPYTRAKEMIKKGGPRSLMRGSLATQLRDCPALGVYFASYEYFGRRFSKDGTIEALSSSQLLFAGGLAGMFSWISNYPTDFIKTRFQADERYSTYKDLVIRSYAERGVKGFFVGLGPTLIRAFPTNAATFFAVEWTYRLMLDSELTHPNSLNVEKHNEFAVSQRAESKWKPKTIDQIYLFHQESGIMFEQFL